MEKPRIRELKTSVKLRNDGSRFGLCDVSVIIPVKNEATNLTSVLPDIPREVGELILVIAESDERSVGVVNQYVPQAKVVRDPGHGKGHALKIGFRASSKPLVVHLDADGSMNPADIPRYLSLLTDGADIVKGSRNLPGGGSNDLTHVRVFGNQFFAWTVNFLFGTRFTDLCYGFMAVRRHVLDSIAFDSDGFNVEAEILIKAHLSGFTIQEIPSFENRRIHGKSNLHWIGDGIQILATILSLFARSLFSRSEE